MRKCLLVFRCNYGPVLYHFRDVQSVREFGARDHARSLKVAVVDGSYTTSYQSAIVTIALSYLTLNNIMTLKSGLEMTQGH